MSISCDILTVALDAEEQNWLFRNASPSGMRVYVTHRLTDENGTVLSAADQQSATVTLVNYNYPSTDFGNKNPPYHQTPWSVGVRADQRSINADGSLTTLCVVDYATYDSVSVPVAMRFAAAVSPRGGGRFTSAAFGQPGDTVISKQPAAGLGRGVTIIYNPNAYPGSNY